MVEQADPGVTALSVRRARFFGAENAGLGLARIQSFHRREGVADAVAERLGRPLPRTGEIREGEGERIFWSAPGEWVVALPIDVEARWIRDQVGNLAGLPALLSPMGDSHMAVELGGEDVRDVLARASTVDFSPDRFVEGRTVVTRFAGITVLLGRPRGADNWLLVVDRSLAAYLFAWLESASVV